MDHNITYNTEMEGLKISEYGRIVQEYVKYICAQEDKKKRLDLTNALVRIIAYMNPELKQQEDYEQIIWDHLHIISDFNLNVDSPYPLPDKEEINTRPDAIGYATQRIRFRFYGRNLQRMVDKASQMEDGEDKTNFVNIIASFMHNSSRNWNNEMLTDDVIADHLSTLSKGKIKVDAEELKISVDNQPKRTYNKRSSAKKKSKGKSRHSRNR